MRKFSVVDFTYYAQHFRVQSLIAFSPQAAGALSRRTIGKREWELNADRALGHAGLGRAGVLSIHPARFLPCGALLPDQATPSPTTEPQAHSTSARGTVADLEVA